MLHLLVPPLSHHFPTPKKAKHVGNAPVITRCRLDSANQRFFSVSKYVDEKKVGLTEEPQQQRSCAETGYVLASDLHFKVLTLRILNHISADGPGD